MSETLDIFAGAVQEIANGPRVSSFHELTEGLMRRLSEKGLTLAQLADRKMLARSVSTLEGHCREYGIAFPDYVPANMRKHVRHSRNRPDAARWARVLLRPHSRLRRCQGDPESPLVRGQQGEGSEARQRACPCLKT